MAGWPARKGKSGAEHGSRVAKGSGLADEVYHTTISRQGEESLSHDGS